MFRDRFGYALGGALCVWSLRLICKIKRIREMGLILFLSLLVICQARYDSLIYIF